jgi:hypothetical protein
MRKKKTQKSPIVLDLNKKDQDLLEQLFSLYQRSFGRPSMLVLEAHQRLLETCPVNRYQYSQDVIVSRLKESYQHKLDLADRATSQEVRQQLLESARFERVLMAHLSHMTTLLYQAYKKSISLEKSLDAFKEESAYTAKAISRYLETLSKEELEPWRSLLKRHRVQLRLIIKQTKSFAVGHKQWSKELESILINELEPGDKSINK